MIGALKLRPSSDSVKDSNIGQVWRVGWKVEGSNRAAGIGFFFSKSPLNITCHFSFPFVYLFMLCQEFLWENYPDL